MSRYNLEWLWKETMRNRSRVGFRRAVSAWHSCHPESLKVPLVTSGQATAGLSVPPGLSCAQTETFCSAALLQSVFCPTTWGRLKYKSTGSPFYAFLRDCFCPPDQFCRIVFSQFSQNTIFKLWSRDRKILTTERLCGEQVVFFWLSGWGLPAVRSTVTDANVQIRDGSVKQHKNIFCPNNVTDLGTHSYLIQNVISFVLFWKWCSDDCLNILMKMVEYDKQFQMNNGYFSQFSDILQTNSQLIFHESNCLIIFAARGFLFFFVLGSFSLLESTVFMTEDVIHCTVDC